MEAFGVQLRLTQGVTHRDAGTGYRNPRAVAHARGYGDDETGFVYAGDVCGVRGPEYSGTLGVYVLLAGQSCGNLGVLSSFRISPSTVIEGVLHGPGEDLHIVGVREGRKIVGRDHTHHLRERRPAGGRWTVGVNGTIFVCKGEGLPDDGLVGSEVFFGDDSTFLQDVAGESARQLPLIEQVCSLLPYGL